MPDEPTCDWLYPAVSTLGDARGKTTWQRLRCDEPAVVLATIGYRRCLAHAQLAEGWRLVRESGPEVIERTRDGMCLRVTRQECEVESRPDGAVQITISRPDRTRFEVLGVVNQTAAADIALGLLTLLASLTQPADEEDQ